MQLSTIRTLLSALWLTACATQLDATTPDARDTDAPLVTALAPTPATAAVARTYHDAMAAGPIPGLLGDVTMSHRADAHYCGGFEPVVTRQGKAAGSEELALIDVLSMSYPKGLDFSDANREASLQRFTAWMKDLQARGTKARERYTDTVQRSTDVREKLAAAARIIQIQQYVATVLMHAEIPVDMRSGEFAEDKMDAFCDALDEHAVPLLAQATEAAAACASHATGVSGWWDEVCLAEPKSAVTKQ